MSPFQTLSNVCVAIAALLYLLPLQSLLWDFAHKRNNSASGLIAALVILIPLWLLLLVGLLGVTATGGFDWLRFNRRTLYVLVITATFAMAFGSFLFMGMSPRTPVLQRIPICAPVYLFPLLTMLLVVLSLNPRLAPNLSPAVFRLPWIACASLSLTACLGLVGYQFVRAGGNRLSGVAQRIRSAGQSSSEELAKIAALDPQRDFSDLLRLAGQYQSRAVREAATARLRMNPKFLEALVADLKTRDASRSLEFVCSADLSPDELATLALPTRKAIERFTNAIPAANYMPSDRRKQLQRWGRETLRDLAKKFAATKVDFAPTITAFEQALEPAKRD